MSTRNKFLAIVCSILLILLDQFVKYKIRSSGGFYICNQNIAFGIKIAPSLFWLFWIGIIFFLALTLYKKYFIHDTLYMILILSGAVSNILDRIYHGCVFDYIDLRFWPVFNLADIYITIGAIIILVKSYKVHKVTKLSE
jgi:lipoprotein signal peptidase